MAKIAKVSEADLRKRILAVEAQQLKKSPAFQPDRAARSKLQKSRAATGKMMSRWMTGGGVKRGQVYGATDDFGYNVSEHPVDVHDLQATILHLMGIDHERLIFRTQGRNFRLTDVHGNVVQDVIA